MHLCNISCRACHSARAGACLDALIPPIRRLPYRSPRAHAAGGRDPSPGARRFASGVCLGRWHDRGCGCSSIGRAPGPRPEDAGSSPAIRSTRCSSWVEHQAADLREAGSTPAATTAVFTTAPPVRGGMDDGVSGPACRAGGGGGARGRQDRHRRCPAGADRQRMTAKAGRGQARACPRARPAPRPGPPRPARPRPSARPAAGPEASRPRQGDTRHRRARRPHPASRRRDITAGRFGLPNEGGASARRD